MCSSRFPLERFAILTVSTQVPKTRKNQKPECRQAAGIALKCISPLGNALACTTPEESDPIEFIP